MRPTLAARTAEDKTRAMYLSSCTAVSKYKIVCLRHVDEMLHLLRFPQQATGFATSLSRGSLMKENAVA